MCRSKWIVCIGIGFLSILAHSREQDEIVLTILYDNFSHDPALTEDWGFACLIHGMEENILFDTGTSEEILSGNFDQYGYYRQGVETVVISHLHRDHIGGIGAILDDSHGRQRKVYLPRRVPEGFDKYGEKHLLMPVNESNQVCRDVYTTGVMDGRAPEQGLILDTEQGLILIVGCSHPGIVEMVERTRDLYPDKTIHLVLGGFHLLKESDASVRKIAIRLRDLGVEQIAPTHCTGERAKQIFSEEFGNSYIEAGVGKVFRFPRSFPILKGAYLGQRPPGKTAVVFAPGIVSTQHLEHSAPSFSEDGKEVYWSRWLRPNKGEPETIMTSWVDDLGNWSRPEIAPFSGLFKEGGPRWIDDDRKLVFSSKRPSGDGPEESGSRHLFHVERSANGWTKPELIIPEGTVESDFSSSPAISDNGNLYMDFNRKICVSRHENGSYCHPAPLPGGINSDALDWTPCIAPDERYLIFSSDRSGGFGMGDLYISVKRDDDTWSQPVNMGASVNTWAQERFPGLSPDGKYLFFTRWTFEYDHDIYWVSTEVIEELIFGIVVESKK